MSVPKQEDCEPIAIVGLGCRLPGAASPRALWELLLARGDAVGVLDAESADGRTTSEQRTIRGGFLDHIDRFDASFFGISPREAERLDPQQRILLEVVWEALEDAGLAADRLSGSATGVFVGMWINDYESRMFSESGNIDFHMTTGSGRYTASGRLSNLLDLRGPSLTIDSACSSSLVAVHLACQSLRSGEISLAIVGGVNVILQPHISSAYSQAGMLSPDGRCKFGDARADGYVRSDGVGVVVLKPLGRAREDRDPIHAVILGTAVNNDGRTGYSLGTPGRAGQEDLLRTAYSRAGVAPALVQYVEAHGTGTRAGDPVELAALGAVLGAGRNAKRPCFVGSVKTNIGHTEGAAGLAGLIKVALSLEHRTIPASLHFETPTPEVAWDELALAIPTEALAWPETDRPVAGVSSFGIGGTNAHAVLAAAPIDAASPVDDGVKRESLLVVSARSSDALRGLAEGYCEHLAHPDLPALSDICYTAAVRRTHHDHRLAVIGRDPQEITARLQSLLKASSLGRVRVDDRSLRVAFVFPGQGSQWVGMGRRLAQKEPAFRKAFERCAAAVAAHGGPALIEELNTDEPSRLERVDVVQPALFAVQVALAELWREWGVEPVAVVGHSMGEVAAAHVAGALTLDDAARVISTRSALLRRISGRGAMVMVELSPDELGPVLRGRENQLSIAVCNSPRSTVVAGDVDALDALIEQLGRDGVLCRRVKVDVASHSPQVEPLGDDLLRGLAGLTPLPSRVPMYSTVTGAPIDGARLDAGYWIKNLRETVKFSTAVRRLLEDECDVFVEISPHPILLAAIEQNAGAGRSDLFLPSLRRQEPERAVMLESLGALYVHGYPVDWARLYPSGGYCVGLPSYPWKRQRFWYPTSPTGGRRTLGTGRHPLVEEHIISSADPGTHFWQGTTDPVRVPWLMEYRVDGLAQLPASAIVEMALGAGRTLFSAGGCRVEDVCLESPLVVSEAVPRIMQLVVSASLPGSGTFRFASRDAGADASARWTVHATGTIRTDPAEDETTPSVAEPAVMTDAEPAEDHYEAMRRRGLDYGPSFHGLVETARRGAVTFVRLRATETVRREAGEYEIHPCLLDACLQAVVAGLVASPRGKNITYVPARIGRVILHGRPSGEEDLWCRVAVRAETPDGEIVADIVVADGRDHILIEVTNIRLAPLVRKSGDDLANQVFEIAWRPKSRLPSGRPRNSGRWVILADRRGAGEALAGQLAAHGARCSLIFGRGVQLGAGRAAAAIDPTRLGEYEALVASSSADPIEGVVYLWGLDTPPLDLEPQAAEAVTEALAVQGLVHLVKALVPSGTARSPRIVLATAGTQDVAGGPGRVAIEQAPLWGVGAVIASEYPDLRCVRVDLSAEPTVEEIEGLAGECQEPDGEGQIALRGPSRFVARLVRVVPSAADHVEERRSAPAGKTPFRVHASSAGALDGLHLRPLERRAPGPGEVEIEVHAAGLNFRDVMSALESLPGLFNGVGSMGIECSGRVVAVGERVETVSRGDEVVAIAFGSLGTHVVTDARLVARKPLTLSHQVAATLPIAFVTAWYALHTLAGMRPGERVLIHAASGGVGLAAVQLARKAGAHVFATVGSPRKHEFLRALGVEQVFDSRSLSFAENVRARTGGEGVDIVLNSLAGPAITAGLTTLAPYGRFVELGTRDIYQNSPLGLGPFRSNLSYVALDLVQMCCERPEVVGALLADMMQRFSDGDLEPLPVHMFPIAAVREAFRYMAEARHIGKIVLSLLPEEARVAPLVGALAAVRAEATYLITGGLGALGLTVAGALVDAGARHMVLIGRRAPSEAARRSIAELTRKGVDVVTMEADVTSPERMAGVLETLRREKPPLRGVIHAAGVLDDATLLRLTRDQIRTVMAPKAAGAYMLHVLTQRDPLDFFVLFSSTSALLGLGGQANYAAANAFLDALARHRHRLGQTALSIGWGPWSDIGLAAVSDERGKRLEALGLGSLTPQQGAEAFTRALGNPRAHVAVMEFDAAAWCGGRDGAGDVFFEELSAPTPSVAGDERSPSLTEALRVAPATAREDMLLRHVREQVASVLRFAEPEAIDVARGFFTLGMDSLMAIELKNRLQAALERSLPSTVVFDRPSITQLAGYLGREILGWEASPVAAGAPEPDAVDAEEIRRLPRQELQALLAEELKQLKDLG